MDDPFVTNIFRTNHGQVRKLSSPVATGGLSSPQIEIWSIINRQKFLWNLNVQPPYWRLFGDGSDAQSGDVFLILLLKTAAVFRRSKHTVSLETFLNFNFHNNSYFNIRHSCSFRVFSTTYVRAYVKIISGAKSRIRSNVLAVRSQPAETFGRGD